MKFWYFNFLGGRKFTPLAQLCGFSDELTITATIEPWKDVSTGKMYASVCLSDDEDECECIPLHEFHVCESHCPLLEDYGVRRQSASSFSHESIASRRKLKPVQSLNIDTISNLASPQPSPGLISNNSYWSELQVLRKQSDAGLSDTLSVASNSISISNVSSSLSDRMRELVRAFSSRTQRFKEKVALPPTPSSTSSQGEKSIFSLPDEPPAPRHRLGSYVPTGPRSSVSEKESEVGDMYVGVGGFRSKTWQLLKRMRMPATLEPQSKNTTGNNATLEPQSKIYLLWLFLVTVAFMYNAWVIFLRGVFPYQTADNLTYWLICDYTCDFIYIIDVVIFKGRVRFINNGMHECDRKLTRKHYMKKLMFKMDLLALIPLDFIYLYLGNVNPWLRLPRLLKYQTFGEFYDRCDHVAKHAFAIRILRTMTYMMFLIHIETCGYYAVSVYEGLNSNEWVYSGKGNAYIRCFYLATKTATSIGRNPIPINNLEYVFMTVYWLSGVFVFALLVGQVRDILHAANQVTNAYKKKMDDTLFYMQSLKLPDEMQNRVRNWYTYNWQQQKTLDDNVFLDALPKKMKTDLAISVHFNTLSKVQLFQDCDKNLLYDLVLKLKASLFIPGDYICKKGEVGKEMYIVSEGQVEVVAGEYNERVLATLHKGSVFGEISLLSLAGGNRRTANVRCKGFTNLFILSKVDFDDAMREYPEAQTLLRKRAKKILLENSQREQKKVTPPEAEIIRSLQGTPKMVKTVIQMLPPNSKVGQRLGSINSRNVRPSASNDYDPEDSPQKDDDIIDPGKDGGMFEFSSQLSLSDIPDDNGGDSLDEEEGVLTVSHTDGDILKTPEPFDLIAEMSGKEVIKRTSAGVIREESLVNSDESFDSGLPSTKTGSAGESTTKTVSNKDSKESFNSDLAENIDKRRRSTDVTQRPSSAQSSRHSSARSSRANSRTVSRASSGKSVGSNKVVAEKDNASSTVEPQIIRVKSAETVHMSENKQIKESEQNSTSGKSSPNLTLDLSETKIFSDSHDKELQENNKNMKKTVSESRNIPLENQITCAVEVHREKSVTPSMDVQQDTLKNGRNRNDSVISVVSETKPS